MVTIMQDMKRQHRYWENTSETRFQNKITYTYSEIIFTYITNKMQALTECMLHYEHTHKDIKQECRHNVIKAMQHQKAEHQSII